tara:strand:- start:191 stop:787 length:597 start_codon:yes stop_codon:yes gene_type:complete
MRMVLLIGIPAALALWLLAEPLLVTLFQYGAMTPEDVTQASYSLRAYSLGLLAFMLIKVLAPGYFSRQDTRTPVKIGVLAMAVNMLLNLALIVPLAHAGLALATSLSAFLNAGLLLRGLLRDGVMRWQAGWLRFVLQLSCANLAMAVLLVLWVPELSQWLSWSVWDRAMAMALSCVLGGALYVIVLLLLGVRLRQLRH